MAMRPAAALRRAAATRWKPVARQSGCQAVTRAVWKPPDVPPTVLPCLRAVSSRTAPFATLAADSVGDLWLRQELKDKGPADGVRSALRKYGPYRGSEVAWRSVSDELLTDTALSDIGVGDFKALVHVLVDEVQLTIASFWERMTDKVSNKLMAAELTDLLDLAGLYCKIGCWNEAVFSTTINRVRMEMAVHTMNPPEFAQLLEIFSRAGRSSQRLSRLTGQLFNEAQDRLMTIGDDPDSDAFSVVDLITVVESMARFQVRDITVLQHLGRQRLHAGITSAQPPVSRDSANSAEVNSGGLPASQIASICSAYGELGWRHDTVFKSVATEILEENLRFQRARALGIVSTVEAKYSASDVALVVDAMLSLKLHRGNTSWCKWADNYHELLEVLTRRVEDELQDMRAKPLACASFVLGRARRGTPQLHEALYSRMMRIIEEGSEEVAGSGIDGPHHELAKFLHGLVMMGPTRKKNLDTQWLMHWMCHHPYMFLLSDLILVNRHLVCLGCCETDYLKEFVPWLTERVDELTKSDIMEITQTYNEAGLTDEDLGRHFFWALGRRFQKLRIETSGGKRAPYRRIG